MKFGAIPVAEAAGATLAHSLRVGSTTFKKGRILSADDTEALAAAGYLTVTVAQLEPNDLDENEAAGRIARAAAGPNTFAAEPATGRCNIFADVRGLAMVDPARIDRVNLIDEAVTIATVQPFSQVEPGDLVATVKIITFAVPEAIVERCRAIAAGDGDGAVVRVAAYRPTTVGLIQTYLPGTKDSVIEKTVEVTRSRLSSLGASLEKELRCEHSEAAVAAALSELQRAGVQIALVLGASAIVDRRDVVPSAIVRAGGTVEHFGMPVDPGNLMLLATLGSMRILGLPGSARSIRLHGFDWVLQRLVAGIEVTGGDLMRMGVGGLLKEIPTRPQPRVTTAQGPNLVRARSARIGALILAAGQSRRMGTVNKLLADIDGRPMVAHVVDAALASAAASVVVVTGHEAERVRSALSGRPVRFVHNPAYAEGLSTSLSAGLAAFDSDIDGVLICLGDMPDVTVAHMDRLIAAFDPAAGRAICVPTFKGKRGNPVLWARRFFHEMASVSGDVGARHLIGDHASVVHEVAMPDSGVLRDLDTPEALAARKAARDAGHDSTG